VAVFCGEFFGIERLPEILREHGRIESQALMELVLERLRVFAKGEPWHDDVTTAVVQLV
jgi:serine phosphatase RsbU (regulator of sigma subunit)